ncbi:AAA family ATPase [Streptosporangium sp. NBC_01755]|uniref:helix-turn-helix transcriptional regulator n=1 Tax=unclassified Streptosporangium TaxID=2632669 RepID=UPI002DDC30EA|nr:MULTISPECIES: AAA family ATPase [unclassified Streptosporangium]WSA28900.1 AAA family ATPase [Streptosporangium sp. NBC_01810]WSC99653.1 AAA family ATPase [Streptosporangium sp. NBC_01755]
MHGRRDEQAAVLALLGGIASPTVNVMLVEGEPGIGKTLLLGEAAGLAAAQGTAVASGRADELGRLTPLGPLLSALEESPAPMTVTRNAFPDGPGLLLWLAEQVRTSLERRLGAGPLLVTLDDLQWADPATLMALRTLPSRLAERPVAWLLACRSTPARGDARRLFDLLEEEGATRTVLRPLGEGAVTEVSTDILGAIPGKGLAALAAQAGGNPLLLSEYLTGLREEGAVLVEDGVARLAETAPAGAELPLRVHTAVRRRLNELGTRTRYLLEATAVLGRSFSPAYAAEMLGETPAALLPALEEALAAGVLVTTPDELAFRHELLWRSVVERVPQPVRRALREQVERAARARPAHLTGGGGAETLTDLALLAWDEGRLSHGLDLAREAVGKPAGGRWQPRAVLASMLIDLWLLDEAEATTESAAAEAEGEPAWAAEIPVLRARLHLAAGRLGSAIEHAEAGLTTAGTLDAPLLASSALSVLGTAALRAGDLPRAIRYMEGDFARSARCLPPYTRLRSELVAGRINEARDGAAGGMSSLGVLYDALPRHTGALTSEPTAAAWLVRMAMAAGQRHRADTVVDAAEGIAWRNPGLPNPSVAADHARGLREGDPEALGRAAAGHRDPWARGSAAEDLGVLLGTGGGCRDLAVENLKVALACYGAVEATRDAARVRGRLRLLGERRRHWVRTTHPTSGWASLTGTEQAVCDLVSQGLTNRNAAEQMFISEHTVAFHLRQVFRKLGIHSRVELARLSAEEGAHQGHRAPR